MDTEKRILIAEKESIAGSYMQKMMERSGWASDLVTSINSLLGNLAAQQYDALVISNQLQDGTGTDAVKQIRQRHGDLHLIIGMANSSLASEQRLFEQAGTNHCLIKPVYQKQLVKILRGVTKRQAGNVSIL